MVNRQKLTEKVLREAEPAEGRDYQIFDTEVRGFAACILRAGVGAVASAFKPKPRLVHSSQEVPARAWLPASDARGPEGNSLIASGV